MVLISVDLPHPFGPKTETCSRASMRKLMPSSAIFPQRNTRTSRNSSSGAVVPTESKESEGVAIAHIIAGSVPPSGAGGLPELGKAAGAGAGVAVGAPVPPEGCGNPSHTPNGQMDSLHLPGAHANLSSRNRRCMRQAAGPLRNDPPKFLSLESSAGTIRNCCFFNAFRDQTALTEGKIA